MPVEFLPERAIFGKIMGSQTMQPRETADKIIGLSLIQCTVFGHRGREEDERAKR